MTVANFTRAPARRTVHAVRTAKDGTRFLVRRLRMKGSASFLVIPPDVLRHLGLAADAQVNLRVEEGRLVVEPIPALAEAAPTRRRRRYTLAQLLEGAEHLPQAYAGTEGALDGPPVGQEIG